MTLEEAMRAKGFNDETLAEAVGVSRPFITRLKNRKRKPSITVAAKLEELTGVSPSWFAEAG